VEDIDNTHGALVKRDFTTCASSGIIAGGTLALVALTGPAAALIALAALAFGQIVTVLSFYL
jgi:hypothetical protein